MIDTIVVKNFTSKNKHKYKPGCNASLKRGYARYLIKEGKVLAATLENKNIAQKILEEENKKRELKLSNANALADRLRKEKIFFIVTQYNSNGILFGKITTNDIFKKLHKLSKDYNNIKNNDIVLSTPVKSHGTYVVTVHLYETEVKIPVFVGKSDGEIKKMYEAHLHAEEEQKVEKEEEEKNE